MSALKPRLEFSTFKGTLTNVSNDNVKFGFILLPSPFSEFNPVSFLGLLHES